MLNASINVVFFAACCLCHCLFKNPAAGTLRFYGSFHCGWRLCVWGLSDFTVFSVCGAPVSGDFEILRFFRCVWGSCVWGLWDFAFFYLCVRTLRVYVFSPYVWGLCVYGDFEILCFSPVCGPCVGDFEIKKISNREKSQVWGFEMAVTQRKKKRWQSNPSDLLYIIWLTLMDWSTLLCCLNVDQMLKNTLFCT